MDGKRMNRTVTENEVTHAGMPGAEADG
jgi:hypothetical protein